MDPNIDPERLKQLLRKQPWANAVIVTVSLLLLFPLIIVALRMYVRIYIAKKVQTDDFFVILASSGVALHLLHFMSVWALKMSVCCFCLNIFGRVISRRKNFIVWASMATVSSIWIISSGTLIFSCSPVSSLWDARKVATGDGCINIAAEQLALAIINAISDWLIMYLPLALLKQSDLNSTQKTYISGIFSLAFVAALASIGRVISYGIVITGFYEKSAMLWWLLPISTSFELNCAIAASSLPSLSPLFRSAARRFRGGNGKGDVDWDMEPDFIKPLAFYDKKQDFGGESDWDWDWQSEKLDNGNEKTGKGGIVVETSYVVDTSGLRCPSKALFSSTRWAADRNSGKMGTGAGGVALGVVGMNVMKPHPLLPIEARESTTMGNRLSFLEMLKQGPPSAEEGSGKGGRILGI
ncbi:integral membrane protein [Venturia nashicola]|uniref:Integral membrane protein n=1 Tax=Venturia nashicola TaxID=86259 RepID=A0A4Z1NM58_9PEZI|nr:integral membrane protein [Venturia nashicola]